MTAQIGLQLQREALDRSQQGRQAAIQQVREKMLTDHIFDHGRGPDRITGDDVLAAAEELGLAEGDRRWISNVLRGWSAVRITPDWRMSQRPECHARLKRVWVWV